MVNINDTLIKIIKQLKHQLTKNINNDKTTIKYNGWCIKLD